MSLLQTTIATLNAVREMDDMELNFIAYPQAVRDRERIEIEAERALRDFTQQQVNIVKAARRRVEVIEAEQRRRLPVHKRWWQRRKIPRWVSTEV